MKFQLCVRSSVCLILGKGKDQVDKQLFGYGFATCWQFLESGKTTQSARTRIRQNTLCDTELLGEIPSFYGVSFILGLVPPNMIVIGLEK